MDHANRAETRLEELSPAFRKLTGWPNLLCAWRRAARGKRGGAAVAEFEFRAEERLGAIREALLERTYMPGPYAHFFIHEPKRRKISAAPFADRVVHHALTQVIEPRFEALFHAHSYANRRGFGNLKAVQRMQALARQHRYVLRADIRQHFASIDHAVLKHILWQRIPEADLRWLISVILGSGADVLADEYRYVRFEGDDLLSQLRPRGLPIGNLTSQFWSNCYLHPFDQFVQRELGCRAYLRYVDDFALLSDCTRTLWGWKQAIIERLAGVRLTVHATRAQVTPVRHGIPWLGFVLYPHKRRVKARKVRATHKRLHTRLDAYHNGDISFGELHASIIGWQAHAAQADTLGLRERVLDSLVIVPARHERAKARS
ncbi:MAG: RNA-directed DNA polymerase [Pseudomonadota bacterium]